MPRPRNRMAFPVSGPADGPPAGMRASGARGPRRRIVVAQLVRLTQLLEDLRSLRLEEAIELLLELLDPRRRNIIELALRRGVEDRDLLLDRQRLVLRLLDDLGQLLTPRQLVAS